MGADLSVAQRGSQVDCRPGGRCDREQLRLRQLQRRRLRAERRQHHLRQAVRRHQRERPLRHGRAATGGLASVSGRERQWPIGRGRTERTLTTADNPATPTVNEAGQYRFLSLIAGNYVVRAVAQPGYRQVAPVGNQLTSSAFPAGSNPQAVAVVDFSGDGLSDLAVTNGESNNVTLLRNTGDGTFVSAGTVNVGYNPTSIAVRRPQWRWAGRSGDGEQLQRVALAAVESGRRHVCVRHSDRGTRWPAQRRDRRPGRRWRSGSGHGVRVHRTSAGVQERWHGQFHTGRHANCRRRARTR